MDKIKITSQHLDDVIDTLSKMSDDELVQALESCESSVAYAVNYKIENNEAVNHRN